MEMILTLVDFLIHLDRYLGSLIKDFGGWTYVILLLVIFCETGLVVTPILPGDSLLLAGYYFGNIALVKENFTIVLLAIVFLSILPGGIGYLRQRSAAGR